MDSIHTLMVLSFSVVAMASCWSDPRGHGSVSAGTNRDWSAGAGGPGIAPISAAETIVPVVDGLCPEPGTEFKCPSGDGCCPNGTECCESGANAGTCASDCSVTYASDGCPESAPTLCTDGCCPGDCDSSGSGCAETVASGGGTTSTGGSDSVDSGSPSCSSAGESCSADSDCCSGSCTSDSCD